MTDQAVNTLPLRMIASEMREIITALQAGRPIGMLTGQLRDLADQVDTHAGYVPGERDHEMIHHAKARGLVRLKNGDRAVLVSWRPKGHRDSARLMRPGSTTAFTCPIDAIEGPIDLVPRFAKAHAAANGARRQGDAT